MLELHANIFATLYACFCLHVCNIEYCQFVPIYNKKPRSIFNIGRGFIVSISNPYKPF